MKNRGKNKSVAFIIFFSVIYKITHHHFIYFYVNQIVTICTIIYIFILVHDLSLRTKRCTIIDSRYLKKK